MNVVIFEDTKAVNFNPLALTHPVYELRCGMTSLRKKIERVFPSAKISLHCRQVLAEVVQETNPETFVNKISGEKFIFINGRVLADETLAEKIDLKTEAVYLSYDTVVAAVLPLSVGIKTKLQNGALLSLDDFQSNHRIEVDAKVLEYPWHLIHENPSQIESEFTGGGEIIGKIYPNVTMLNEPAIHIAEGAKVMPGVVLDAEGGPIYIDKGAKVMANAVVEGPCYIGEKTTIKIAAKIYEGCSFGPVCKIGGEVEESIVHGYSNKQHEGFLGHAYLGEWCNLGADTNNSDLKNNYSNVKVQINDTLVDSGSLFVGLFMGDHSKSGINTMFNTGTVVGVGCNVYGADFSPRFIPSYYWGGSSGQLVKYDFDKIMATAEKVMARRDVTLTDSLKNLHQAIYDSEQPKILDKK